MKFSIKFCKATEPRIHANGALLVRALNEKVCQNHACKAVLYEILNKILRGYRSRGDMQTVLYKIFNTILQGYRSESYMQNGAL